MRKISRYIKSILLVVLGLASSLHGAEPIVSYVTAQQRPDGTEIVDIYYDLSDPDTPALSVELMVSADGGRTFNLKPTSTEGAVGSSVTRGTGRHIIWYAGEDIPGASGTNYKVAVVARDSNVFGTTLHLDPPYPNGCYEWYTVNVRACLSTTGAVQRTEYELNDSGWQQYSGCLNLSREGSSTFRYRSIGVDGTTEQAKSATIKIDKTPPITSASASGDRGCDGWFKGPVQVTLDRSDATSGVQKTEYRIDGGGWQTYTAPFTIDQECEHDVYYKSEDNACNWESEKSIHVKLDMTPPTSSVALDPAEPNGCNGYYVTPVTFTVSSTDSCSGVQKKEYKIDGGPWMEYTAPVVIDYECEHDFYYRAEDNACNWEEPKSVHVKIDLYAPVITVNAPQPTTYTHADTITVDYNVTDSCSGVKWHEAWLQYEDSCDCNSAILKKQYNNGDQMEMFWLGLEPPPAWFWVDAEDFACWKSHKDVKFNVIATIDSMFYCTNKCREMEWIHNDGIHNSLIQKLTAAKAAYGRGQMKTTRNILEAYIHECEQGLTFQQINMKGYCHLVQDARYVIEQLGQVDKNPK